MVNSKLRREVIKIQNLHCSQCIRKIELEIGSLEGIENIKVRLDESKVFVTFNPKKINLEKIKSRIASLGYCCCLKKPCICGSNKKNKTLLSGIVCGLIPHVGCIAFIIASILGVSLFMQFFRPVMMSRYIFYYLILISVGFATLSSFFYLRKNGSFSLKGIKREKKYLLGMYGLTIGINLILFFLVFPLLANVSSADVNFYEGNQKNLERINISVDIPCPGHALLISNELKTIEGVITTKFSFPKNFKVVYNPSKTNLQEILDLEVFREYPAKILDD